MKITDVSVNIFGVPAQKGRATSRNWIFVRIDTDEGVYGIGEATTEFMERAVEAAITQDFGPTLIGQDPTRVAYIWQKLQRLHWWRGGVVQTSAMSGIDMALWDITGKAYGQPVYKLLGGALRDRVQLYARPDLGLGSDEAEYEQMKREGFTAIKSGVPRTAPFNLQHARKQAESVARMRELAGPETELMLDLGAVMPPPMAARFIADIEPYDILFVEEPCTAEPVTEMQRLRRAFPAVAIAAGERCFTRWGFREWIEKGAVDVIQPDLSHCGGITELIRIASMAEVYHVRVAPHGPYGPVNKAAGVHAAACIANFLLLEHCRMPPYYDDVQTQGITIKNGNAELPSAPGLGVDLDWKYVKKFPYAPVDARFYTQADGSEPLV